MTEERRKMIEILKEVDDFFQQCGVYEAVGSFYPLRGGDQ